MDAAFLRARIDSTKALILVYDNALTALLTDGVQEYRLDTGQTVTNVTKIDIADLQKTMGGLMNRLATLSARLNGSGSTMARPAF